MGERVSLTVKDHVAEVRLTRADKLNAIDDQMVVELVEAARAVEADRSVRVVVLCGEGRSFSSGRDAGILSSAANGGPRPTPLPLHDWNGTPIRMSQYCTQVWRDLSVPVIAAVQGVAVGGGLHLALGADIRFVAPDAKLGFVEVAWGLNPDMGGTPVAVGLVREDLLRELVFTGRTFTGEQAVAYGFATHLSDDPRAAAMDLAKEIVGRSPDAVRAAKRLLKEAGAGSVADGLVAESRTVTALAAKPNQLETVRARLEKRAPSYTDPEV